MTLMIRGMIGVKWKMKRNGSKSRLEWTRKESKIPRIANQFADLAVIRQNSGTLVSSSGGENTGRFHVITAPFE